MARYLWAALGLASIVFHLGLIFSGLVPNLVARPFHLALALPWVLIYASQGRAALATGWALTVVGVAACGWIAWNHDALGDQYGFLEGNFQLGLAIVLICVVLEAARRATAL